MRREKGNESDECEDAECPLETKSLKKKRKIQNASNYASLIRADGEDLLLEINAQKPTKSLLSICF